MKLNSLQIGKAMSAALFVLLLSVVGMKNAFAQNQVATLQHNDTISAFYGMNAFVEAYTAATNGDIITLSSGSYNNCNIEKAIIIRGAGCVYDSETQVTPTIIQGNFQLRHNDSSFEGVRFTGTISNFDNLNNVSFLKCNINVMRNPSNYSFNPTNFQFVNCIVKNFECGGDTKYFHGLSVINSVVRFTKYYHSDVYNPTTFNNSVVLFDSGQNINNIVAYNSIFATVSGHTVLNCTFFNCIGIETGETLLFEGQTAQNVMEVDGFDDVFEAFTGEVSYDNIYWLKEEVATSFLGNDGTEVGIYGGMMPYNPRPSYMIMKRCNVAPRSTVDGKLSVDIEIIAEDE